MSESHGFNQLNKNVQKWIWKQGWSELKDIQEAAISPILSADYDVIISSPTASGKTEAAFLPACSRIADLGKKGIGILYISPLKALINDQYRRLKDLCEMIDMPLTVWHGDALVSKKNKLRKKPEGVLLITPESLESLLLHQSSWCSSAFNDLSHMIIDEFHAFIGTERGMQLLSLMHRIEFLIQKIVPRIALSATLGDIQSVPQTLRANKALPHKIIESSNSRSELKVQQRGYISPASIDIKGYQLCSLPKGSGLEENKLYIDIREQEIEYKVISPEGSFVTDKIDWADLNRNFNEFNTVEKLQPILPNILDITSERGHTRKQASSAFNQVTKDLFKILRGKSHLIFANSRSFTEQIAANLSDRCHTAIVPNEFFPHHGNLSKEIRESLEARLQDEKLPTSAICTMTLELGIDIGYVNSIAQVTAPHSVASLRQRIGRSGRREEPSILRLFIIENEITDKTNPIDKLRLETIQSIAMVNLLINKWYEPPDIEQYHLSTLIQQTLSIIGQYGGVRATQLWELLCKSGPFKQVSQAIYKKILSNLGKQDLISQTLDGQLILGYKGENLVEHYTFYCAFNTPEEYRLECEGRTLGSLPIDNTLMPNQLIIFAGKRWKVIEIIAEKKVIILKKARGGEPPRFQGTGQLIHNIVRQEMLRIYKNKEYPIYLNKTAITLFEEGMKYFHAMQLDKKEIFQNGADIYLFPWQGDQTTNTITALLRKKGLSADSIGGVIELSKCKMIDLKNAISKILNEKKPSPQELASCVPDTFIEKHDHFLCKELRELNYGNKFFDIDSAWSWLDKICSKRIF